MPKATRTPRPIVSSDWSGFKLAMLSHAAYQRVSNVAENQLAVNRLETFFSIQGEELPLAAQLWKAMISSCPASMQPVAAEAAEWDAIAAENDMPITFDSSGLLQVVEDAN